MKLLRIKNLVLTLAIGGVFSLNVNAQSNLVNSISLGTYTFGNGVPYQGYGTLSGGVATSQTAGSNNLIQGYTNTVALQTGGIYTASYIYNGSGSYPSIGNSFTVRTTATNTVVQSMLSSLTHATSSTFTFSGATGSYVLIFSQNNASSFTTTGYSLVFNGLPTPPPSGPSAADTQASLQNTAAALHSTYALQNSVVANSLNYDCQVFDTNNICVSAGGRNTNVQAGGVNNVSALLIAAYRAMPEVRIGAYLDQNLSVTANNSPVNLGVNSPLFGLFAVWNENQDGTGTEVKVSGAYGQKNTTITRAVVGTSEAGTGSSTLSNSGVQAIAKYGFGLTRDAVVSPYVGIRYSQGNMGGYTEATSASVTTPLTYSALNTNATTFMAGVHGKYKLTPEATVQASVGLESDMNTNNGSLTASGITGLTPVNFNPNPVKTRPVAMLGAYYDVQKNQRVAVTGIYRQEAYQAIGSTTALATYTVGF